MQPSCYHNPVAFYLGAYYPSDPSPSTVKREEGGVGIRSRGDDREEGADDDDREGERSNHRET